MGRDIASIRQALEQTRGQLAAHAYMARDEARTFFNWRTHVARHPWLTGSAVAGLTGMVGAVALGVVRSFRRPSVRMLQGPALAGGLAAPPAQTSIGALLAAAALRFAWQAASRQVMQRVARTLEENFRHSGPGYATRGHDSAFDDGVSDGHAESPRNPPQQKRFEI